MYPIDTINHVLAQGTIVLQILTVGLLALFFLRKRFPDLEDVAVSVQRWGLWVAFLFTLAGTALTIFYSDVLGFLPCGWCWVQRVFLWSQAPMFLIAAIKRDRTIAIYSIVFSALGGAVALYQHYLQMGGSGVLPCPANPGVADCAQRLIFEFGYITFPLMSASLFAFLIVVMMFVRVRK